MLAPDLARRAARHIGRRGAFLAVMGALWVLLGTSYLGNRPTPGVIRALTLAHRVAPLWLYGLCWIGAGAIAIVCGLLFSPDRDTPGFAALITLPVLFSIAYLAAWRHRGADGLQDAPRGWTTALLFIGLAAAILAVSGMPNPSAIRVEEVNEK